MRTINRFVWVVGALWIAFTVSGWVEVVRRALE